MDILLIRQLFEYINEQYRISPSAGYQAEADSDYFAHLGSNTTVQCVMQWAMRDGGQLRFQEVPIERTITETPNWQLPGRVRPPGRIYAVTVRETVSSPDHRFSNGQFVETYTTIVHISLLPSGWAWDFIPCVPPRSA